MTKAIDIQYKAAIDLAIAHILEHGADDVFRPPMFAANLEVEVLKASGDVFRKYFVEEALAFLKKRPVDLTGLKPPCSFFYPKDHQNFRRISWIDLKELIKYTSLVILLSKTIEANRPDPKKLIIHSYRISSEAGTLFDKSFGYDSFRTRSALRTKEFIGGYKIITDISNFFDRINLHSLENILLEIGCDKELVASLDKLLKHWAGLNSFGVPVGCDASRVLAEASLINVDRRLMEDGIQFLRYVDDYRIFTKDRSTAYDVMIKLTEYLHDEGLFINSSKTSIMKINDDNEENESDRFNELFATEAHKKIDEKEVVEVTKRIRVSGQSRISKFYRKPGIETIKRLATLSTKALYDQLHKTTGIEQENVIRNIVKYYIYANQDWSIIEHLIKTKITSIYYIADALCKDGDRLSVDQRKQVLAIIIQAIDFFNCPYVYQIPVLKICACHFFNEETSVSKFFDSMKIDYNSIAYREALISCSGLLNRTRLKKLAKDHFDKVPLEVQRTIVIAIQTTSHMAETEKRPLLKRIKDSTQDKIIQEMIRKSM